MNKSIIKLVSILLVTILFLTTIIGVNANSTLSFGNIASHNNIRLLHNSEQSFLISTSNNQMNIEGVYPKTFNRVLTLNSRITDYILSDDTVVIVCDTENDQTEFVIYNINQNNFKSFVLNDTIIGDAKQFAFDGQYIYYINSHTTVEKFSTQGKHIKTYTFDDHLMSLLSSKNGTLLVHSYYGVYRYSNDSFIKISNNSLFPNSMFISDTMFMDGDGWIYDISQNQIVKPTEFESDVMMPSGGVYSEYIIASKANIIYAISKTDGLLKKSFSLNNNIEQINVIGDKIIAMTYVGKTPVVDIINFSEFKQVKQPILNNQNNSQYENYTINSDVYTVDNMNYKIKDIPHGTTAAKFKKNMNFDGYNVEFTRYDGKIIKSGNVGTATIARFYNDTASYEYELSVLGDLTGEGNLNSRDKDLMFKFLLKLVSFNGVYLDSANLHKEQPKIDVADLVVMARLIKKDKLKAQG